MTNPISLKKEEHPLSLRKDFILPSFPLPIKEREILRTAYFCIPTAIRVKDVYGSYIQEAEETFNELQPPLEKLIRFFTIFKEKILGILKKTFREKPIYYLSEINPPKQLLVPRLPQPPFYTHPLSPYVHDSSSVLFAEEGYAPACLMRDSKQFMVKKLCNELEILRCVKEKILSTGTIAMDRHGFIYLSFPDEILREILPLIKKTSQDQIFAHPLGVHAAGIIPTEFQRCTFFGLEKVIGKEVKIEITGSYSLEFFYHPILKTLFFLSIRCPFFEKLRRSLLLPSKIFDQDFHIVLCLRKRLANLPYKELFRLNVSCFAA